MNNKTITLRRIIIALSIFTVLFGISTLFESISFFPENLIWAFSPIFPLITSVCILLYLIPFKNNSKKRVILALVFLIWGFEWLIYKNFIDRIAQGGTMSWWGILSNIGNISLIMTLGAFLSSVFGALSITAAIGILKNWETKLFIISALALGVLSNVPSFHLSISYAELLTKILFSILYLVPLTYVLFFENVNFDSDSDNNITNENIDAEQ